MTEAPSLADVSLALGGRDVPQEVYDAEVADQASRCRVDPYNAALGAALIRRVSRAIAMRNLPLAVLQDDVGATRLGSADPEVRRLEAPYRRLVIG